jgi:arylsulfatase A-like enzyme
MEIAGGKVPDGLHGRSLVPILRGETPADWRKSVYYHYYDPGHGVARHYGLRTDRYTLAFMYPYNEWELYDLEKDPQQMRSVYDDPAYAKTVAALKTELVRLREQFKDAGGVPGSKSAAIPGDEAPAKKGKKKKN